jgi:hypothetical protein
MTQASPSTSSKSTHSTNLPIPPHLTNFLQFKQASTFFLVLHSFLVINKRLIKTLTEYTKILNKLSLASINLAVVYKFWKTETDGRANKVCIIKV